MLKIALQNRLGNPLASLPLKPLIISAISACALYLLFTIFVMLNGASTLRTLETGLAADVIAYTPPQEKMAGRSDLFAKPHGDDGQSDGEHDDFAMDAPPALSKDALLPAPFEGLTEETQDGWLPVIGGNNLSPFKAYKKPYIRSAKKPAIALVVRGFDAPGMAFTDVLQTLPDTISILISPYNARSDTLQKTARAAAHEVWLNVAFETKNFPADDPGPRGILSHVGIKYNKDNLHWNMAQTSGYAGIAGFMDEAFGEAKPMLRGLLQNIFGRGLGYIELNKDASNFGGTVALSQSAPYIKNMLPPEVQDQGLDKVFERIKVQAHLQNYAVAVLNLNPVLLKDINTLIAAAEQEGFEIVPLSTLADSRL